VSWITGNIRVLMVVSGVLTLTMVYSVFAPEAALQFTFGESLNRPESSSFSSSLTGKRFWDIRPGSRS